MSPFLDMAATILICTPIFLSIGMQLGLGPVPFGMPMPINCALGRDTPPAGATQVRRLRHRRRRSLMLVTYMPEVFLGR